MDARLSKLIHDYQAKVAEAVAMVEHTGIPRPRSNVEWTTMDTPGRFTFPNGFRFYKHGFGCSVDGPEWGVDFDFGDEGQIDGFDAYRLHDFARKRLAEYGFQSESEIGEATKDAAACGELRFSGYILFYVTDLGKQAMSVSAG